LKICKVLHKIFELVFYILFSVVNNLDFRPLISKKQRRKIDSLRVVLLRKLGVAIGSNVYISKNFYSTSFKNLSFGKNGTLGINCQLYNYGEGISIGDNFLIGSNLTVHTSEHVFSNPTLPIIKQNSKFSKVKIGNNVYIGSGVTILSGVQIGDNVIIGAGSVVTKNLDSNFIYAGNPAVKIKSIY
jgi:maltose O-acetyltransferase